ncbi:MAG: glutamate-5-semialdehyde dehydrogenase [Nitrospinota bacterium]|nr:glutamate-5-semialdehyde dehydrogenase [Nitrospinota bacterium]
MGIFEETEALVKRAKVASRAVALLSTERKNAILLRMADELEAQKDAIQKANAKDMEAGQAAGLSSAVLDRLRLDDKRIKGMADGVREIEMLPDPVGEVSDMRRRPSGIMVGRMRVPIGLVGFIYESRPNVTSDAAALCFKSGNAVVLRGGSEAIHSNLAVADVISKAAQAEGAPEGGITIIPIADREAVASMLKLDHLIDIIIPRGGAAFIKYVTETSSIPVIKHDAGVCHVYVDKKADLAMAVEIAFNSKVQRPSVCNAAETLLVHKDVAQKFLPSMVERFAKADVEMVGCDKTRSLVSGVGEATEEDWYTEYLELKISIRVVESLDEAVDHLTKYGSAHTESIVTEDYAASGRFMAAVDSSSVMVNASTRFSDGGEYGLGAEIGISTQKLHARGPMGLNEMTCQKFIVLGSGQIRK